MDNRSDLQEFSMHLSRREMRAYLSDKLTTQEATRIDKHLKFCEHCSVAMVTIVEQDDQSNYKRNVEKVNDKLKVPIRKKYQWDSAKIKKGLMVAASVGMLSFTAYAFYSFINKESTVDRPGATIAVKPLKEEPAAKTLEKNTSEVKENKPQQPAASMQKPSSNMQEKASKTKQQPIEPLVSEVKKSKPVTSTAAVEEEKKEDLPTEISNTVLVGRRKEQSAEKAVEEVVQPTQEEDQNTETKVVDANPSGGYGSFNQYIAGNLQYPASARENGVEGQVPVEFLVEEDGTLSNFTVKKPLGFGCDKEAIRLIKDGPQWKPATEDGKSVSKTVTVTINFKLEE